MIRRIKLCNDHHGTSVSVLVRCGIRAGRLSALQTRRVKRALCGSLTCTCSGLSGIRGEQPCIPDLLDAPTVVENTVTGTVLLQF